MKSSRVKWRQNQQIHDFEIYGSLNWFIFTYFLGKYECATRKKLILGAFCFIMLLFAFIFIFRNTEEVMAAEEGKADEEEKEEERKAKEGEEEERTNERYLTLVSLAFLEFFSLIRFFGSLLSQYWLGKSTPDDFFVSLLHLFRWSNKSIAFLRSNITISDILGRWRGRRNGEAEEGKNKEERMNQVNM